MVQKHLANLSNFGLTEIEKICAYVLGKKNGSFTPSESCISLVSCQNPGNATFKVYIHLKITQGVNQCSTPATEVSDVVMVRCGTTGAFDFGEEGMQNCLLTMWVLATAAFCVGPVLSRSNAPFA